MPFKRALKQSERRLALTSKYVGIIPDFVSVTEDKFLSMGTVPGLKNEISREEMMQGMIYKGPFVVKHPGYKDPFLCVELQSQRLNTLGFHDGDKFFELEPSGSVRWVDNEIVIPYARENGKIENVKIRRLMESDVESFSSEKIGFNAFAKKMFKVMTTDPYDMSYD